eukprot:CAMPEP_0201587500 /NCGR_PEP_ID=MMETSP0190_2-20130828/144480_1 /ASSEMBLY_ACC=CAM_ASM_000263 /TAXON_ID=37353 /ORGANISM="Rosalina sp." /LENGTH=106 /DNA_ID=CAMNT_0048037665 /DNA_START=471 /DNA_END=788 /DNA_ORIENTATION=-
MGTPTLSSMSFTAQNIPWQSSVSTTFPDVPSLQQTNSNSSNHYGTVPPTTPYNGYTPNPMTPTTPYLVRGITPYTPAPVINMNFNGIQAHVNNNNNNTSGVSSQTW